MIDIIEEHKSSSSIAIYQDDLSISYKELNDLVNNFFEELESSTVCIIIGNNSINCIAFYIACLRRECIPLLLSSSISKIHLDLYIKNYQPTYIFSETKKLHYQDNYRALYTNLQIYRWSPHFQTQTLLHLLHS